MKGKPSEFLVSRGKRDPAGQVSKVDWQSEKLTSEQGRFLNRIFTEFAQLLAPQLTPLLQLRVMIDLEEVMQRPFRELFENFTAPAPLAVFSLDEKSKGLIDFEAPAAFACLDFLAGGKGEVLESSREFTEIESAVFRNLFLARFASAYSEAWREIAPASCRLENLEFSPNNLTLYPYEETLLTARFILRAGVVTGRFEISLPLKYVRAVLPRNPDQFAVRPEAHMTQTAPAAEAPPAGFLGRKIESMSVTLNVELGKSEVLFQDLLGLEPGDILRLEAEKEDALVIKVGGRTKFLGRPAVSDKKMVIRITDIIPEGDETFDD